MKTLWRLLLFLKPAAGEMLLSVLAGLATITAGVGMLGTSAFLIATAALYPSIAELQVAIVGVRFFGISRGVFRYAERLISHSVNLRVLSNIRVWFYEHLEPLAPARLQDRQSGDLLQRAVGDIAILENFYVRFVMPVIVGVIAGTAASLFIGTLYAPLRWILAAGLILNGAVLPGLVLFSSRKNARVLVQSQALLSAEFVEFSQSLADLQLFGADEEMISRIELTGSQHTQQVRRNAMQNSLIEGVALVVTHLTMLGALWIMIPPVNRGDLSGVLLALAALLILSSFEATTPLPLAAQQLNSSLEAAGRIFEMVDSEDGISEQGGKSIPSAAPDLIQMEFVTFRYGNDLEPVLRNVNLRLERGKKVALVGSSGAGKSTTINLLLRFWNPESGRITMDDQDVTQLDEEWVRRQFGVVNQATTIFNLTLRENLQLAKPGSSNEELAYAISASGLDEWLANLPAGLNTYLGEMGAMLSAGERQRLGLARILLQHPPYLLLDEPISNLDALTGSEVLENLLNENPDAGVLYITHDLLHLSGMDEILMLVEGEIIERGNFSELIASGGTFSRLVELQKNTWLADG